MEKKSLGCSEAPHKSGRVNCALLLQRVRDARPVQVVPNLPGLAIALLEMAEIGRLHEEVVRPHARERVVQDAVQDPRTGVRLAQALDQEIDLLRHAELKLAEVHGLVVRRHEERRRRKHVARSRALLHLILLETERSRVPHGRRGGECPNPTTCGDRPPEQRHRTTTAWSPMPKIATFLPEQSSPVRSPYRNSSHAVPLRSESAPVCQVGAPQIKLSHSLRVSMSASPMSTASRPVAAAM